MPLDAYCARVNGMIDTGQIEDLGCSSVRLEGSTAWRVWLLVDEWRTALGCRPRVRCGVLYQLANHTLSFHGVAVDVVRFLLSMYEAWTDYAITHLPSVQSNHPQEFCTGQNAHAFPLRQCRPARPLRDTNGDNVPTLDYRLPKIALIGLREEVSSVRTQVTSVVLPSVSSVNTGQWTSVNFWRCPVEIDDPPAHRCVPHDSAAPPKCSRRDVDSPDSSDQIIFSLSRAIQSLLNVESDLNCITSAPFFHSNTFVSGQRDLQFVFSIFFIFLFSNIWSQTFEFYSLFDFHSLNICLYLKTFIVFWILLM